MADKKSVVTRLIRHHFDIEPEMKEIFWIRNKNEEDNCEPIKLLEVNAATIYTGQVYPFAFGPVGDISWPTIVAEIAPDELEEVQQGKMPLPKGWSLVGAELFRREDLHA